MSAITALLAAAVPCAAQTASQPAQASPAAAALRDMTEAAGLLHRSDPGQATQSLQADALEQLRRIMEAIHKQQQQQTSQQNSGQQPQADSANAQQQSQADAGAQQQNGQKSSGDKSQNSQDGSTGQKQGDRSGQQQGSGQRSSPGGGQGAKDSALPGEQAPQGAAALPSELGRVDAWGFLPPDQRRQVLQGMQAEPPARYRKLTERYWRVLNDSGQ